MGWVGDDETAGYPDPNSINPYLISPKFILVGMGRAGAGGSKKYEPKLQKLRTGFIFIRILSLVKVQYEKHNIILFIRDQHDLKSISSMKVVAYASMMGHFVPQSWGVITQSTEGSGKGGCNGDSGGPFFCNM